jgi:ATP phosphoribosyltransferase
MCAWTTYSRCWSNDDDNPSGPAITWPPPRRRPRSPRTRRFSGVCLSRRRITGGSRATLPGIDFIEMRPRDAGAWLATGRITGAFISTDIVLEESLEHLEAMPLGAARSDLIVASRDNDGRSRLEDLTGATVATHLPKATGRWFSETNVEVTVVPMGGALEGVCAAGLAEAIVDLRETGSSLAQNQLRVLGVIASCEALFVHHQSDALADLTLRIGAVLAARDQRYAMLSSPHMPSGPISPNSANSMPAASWPSPRCTPAVAHVPQHLDREVFAARTKGLPPPARPILPSGRDPASPRRNPYGNAAGHRRHPSEGVP